MPFSFTLLHHFQDHVYEVPYGNLGLINHQHYDMPDSQPDTIQAADTGEAEVILWSQTYISLIHEQTEGKLLKQLQRSSLGFPISTWKKHCSLFTLQTCFCGNAE